MIVVKPPIEGTIMKDALETGLALKVMLMETVRALDTDLTMLAKDEYANNNGSTAKATRATNRLMAIVALVAPEFIDTERIEK